MLYRQEQLGRFHSQRDRGCSKSNTGKEELLDEMTSQPTGRAPSSDEDKALALDRLAKGMEIGMILCSSSN
ncbi:UNVERIFIED_CONTAM: hypothetical protein Sangu_3086100 [Sesamum angustifolium]|uniref:Uncharacterized protein n=1 Tax=Sesamum angustifolium TaxID=2727405 RepID=A0AAW2K710_9LAMI